MTPQLACKLPIHTRIGLAKLTKLAFDGMDLSPLWDALIEEVAHDRTNTAAIMDMSVIAQLLGDRASGRKLQDGALVKDRLYRVPCAHESPRLRVLVLAAASDVGGNTPIEFLVEEAGDIELLTLYVVPGMKLPDPLPEHDIAFVAVCDADDTRAALDEIAHFMPNWPCPVLNAPTRLGELNRDRLYRVLKDVPGLVMPMTARISRQQLQSIAFGAPLSRYLEDGAYPLIARPVDSHAGHGLDRLTTSDDVGLYFVAQGEEEFFISRYVDYSGDDGLFRKYRIVAVDGKFYACHMAISHLWKIWYLNADMAESAAKREEEARFMASFDEGFAARHRTALDEITRRVGLDYFAIDCAETRDGRLLVFEADNAAIVHNMDSPEIFPYKPAQMRKIFAAFVAMLHARSGAPRREAA